MPGYKPVGWWCSAEAHQVEFWSLKPSRTLTAGWALIRTLAGQHHLCQGSARTHRLKWAQRNQTRASPSLSISPAHPSQPWMEGSCGWTPSVPSWTLPIRISQRATPSSLLNSPSVFQLLLLQSHLLFLELEPSAELMIAEGSSTDHLEETAFSSLLDTPGRTFNQCLCPCQLMH